MDDVYSLFTDEDPAARAQAMAAVLRRKQGLGQLGLLSGDRVLTRVGQGLLGEAEAGGQALRVAGQERLGQRFREALERQRQTFQAGEAAKDRSARSAEASQDRALRLGLAKVDAQAGADKAQAEAKAQLTKLESDLRNKLLDYPETKDALQVAGAVRQIRGATPNGAGDMRLLYAYLRALDPGSAVREGEFATAGKTGGLPGQVQGYYNMLTAKGLLPDDVRAQVKQEAEGLMRQRLEAYRPLQDSFRGLAQQYGVDPSRVVVPLGLDDAPATAPQAAAAPAGRPQRVRGPDGLTYVLQADGTYEPEG